MHANVIQGYVFKLTQADAILFSFIKIRGISRGVSAERMHSFVRGDADGK